MKPSTRYAGSVLASRPTTALLTGTVALAALGLAARPPMVAGLHPLAASALLGSLAMAALGATGGLLWRSQTSPGLGLGRGTLGAGRTAALAIGMVGVSQLLNTLLVESALYQGSVVVEIEKTVAGSQGMEFALFLAAFAIVPGIAEEILFRGFILRGLSTWLRPGLALVASSLLFGLAHFDLVQGGAAAVLGLYLGAVALKGDSIRACIVCHIANNAAAVLTVAASGGADEVISGPAVLTASVAASVLGLAALFSRQRSDGKADPHTRS